jgi:hypothetical protein
MASWCWKFGEKRFGFGLQREKVGKMAKLTTEKRKAIPKKEFGLPGEKKYPMPDRTHAANAKARATQMVAKGKLSPTSAAKIKAKANKVLGGSDAAGKAKAVGAAKRAGMKMISRKEPYAKGD